MFVFLHSYQKTMIVLQDHRLLCHYVTQQLIFNPSFIYIGFTVSIQVVWCIVFVKICKQAT